MNVSNDVSKHVPRNFWINLRFRRLITVTIGLSINKRPTTAANQTMQYYLFIYQDRSINRNLIIWWDSSLLSSLIKPEISYLLFSGLTITSLVMHTVPKLYAIEYILEWFSNLILLNGILFQFHSTFNWSSWKVFSFWPHLFTNILHVLQLYHISRSTNKCVLVVGRHRKLHH